jgi:Xaa-Pro aminopeptidase
MSRLNHLRARMRERSLPGLLVVQAQNRRYLRGFSGSTGWLFITEARAGLLTDSRYWEQG